MSAKTALVIGLSGCSSSGKTTLARLLRDIFPNTLILHEDDFYKPEAELPMKDGLLDWDCAGAIDVPAMADALSHIRQHAAVPPTLVSKEDQNSVGECPVSSSLITTLKTQVQSALSSTHPLQTGSLVLYIIDGFLLYSPSMDPIPSNLDVKFFVRASHDAAKRRREARSGYVTIEGFWSDPPGYVDKIVWPNYVEDHAFMFEEGNVEGKYRQSVLQEKEIRVFGGEEVDVEMEKVLKWMVDELMGVLEKQGQS